MKTKFSTSFRLSNSLEQALSPFSWSGVFSDEFRTSVVLALMASNRREAIDSLCLAIGILDFLSPQWKENLIFELQKFAQEGFPK
jgi:hypothetical protein